MHRMLKERIHASSTGVESECVWSGSCGATSPSVLARRAAKSKLAFAASHRTFSYLACPRRDSNTPVFGGGGSTKNAASDAVTCFLQRTGDSTTSP